MNNQLLIIDMIKTLSTHLNDEGYGRMITELVLDRDQYRIYREDEIDLMADLVDCEDNYIVFGGGSSDEASFHDEMVSYLNNEGYAVINWDDPNDTAMVASTLDRCADNYYVFEHQEDGGHLDEMARMLQECEYLATAPMYDRLQAFGLSPDDTKLHELVAFQGHMVLPTVEHYLEDPTGSEWERDFRQALDHFWSGQGSERQSEKVKFIMNWLADQV